MRAGDDSALFIDKGVKFIYVSFDNDNEVESIEVKSEIHSEVEPTSSASRA